MADVRAELQDHEYAQQLCLIYEIITTADEQTQKVIINKLKEKIQLNHGNHTSVTFNPPFTNDVTVEYEHSSKYGVSSGTFVFKKQHAVVETRFRNRNYNCSLRCNCSICHWTKITVMHDKLPEGTELLTRKQLSAVEIEKELKSFFTKYLIPELTSKFQNRTDVSTQQASAPSALVPAISPSAPPMMLAEKKNEVIRQQQPEDDAPLGPGELYFSSVYSSSMFPPTFVNEKNSVESKVGQPLPSAPSLISSASPPAPRVLEQEQEQKHKQIISEFAPYSLTPQQSAKHPSLNTEEKSGNLYAGVNCLQANELQIPPKNWLSSFWMTTVHVKDGEFGLITHQGKKEFLAPGMYYLPSTTTWERNVKASDSLIQHGNITVVTVPDGHLSHIVNPVAIGDREAKDRNYYLLTPGRHVFNKPARISKVVNPYGLEVSLDTNSRVCFARVCEGKLGYGVITDGSVGVIPLGLKELDLEADNGYEQITFKGRLSTKMQSVTLKKVKIKLDDGADATIDVIVSYEIPNDADLVSTKEKNSVQKIVKKFGYDEEKIKAGIEKEFEVRDEKTGQITKEEGLAIQEVKKQYKNMSRSALLRASKKTITYPALLAAPYSSPPDGVKFHSFLVTNVTLAPENERKQINDVVAQIERHSKADLLSLRKSEPGYSAIRDRVKEKILEPTNAQIQDLQQRVNGPAQNPYVTASLSHSNLPRGDDKKNELRNRGGEQKERLKQLAKPNSHVCFPKDSGVYFNSVDRRVDSGIYMKYENIPCVTADYLRGHETGAFYRGTWFWTKAAEWFSNWIQGKTVKQGEIGLIRIKGRPEFLAPGTYYLPSSVEWIGTKNVSDKMIKHDSITIANIRSAEDRVYAEDNTLRDSEGNLKSYKLLDVGTHVIDSPTTEYRELVPCDKAVVVQKTEDERSRTKLDGKKTSVTPDLNPNNKVLSVTIDPGEVGIYYDKNGEINVLDPGNHNLEAEWKWYKRFSTELQKKKITVQAYTADEICVTVNTTVTYQIPPQNVCRVIRDFGINKYENEIERLLMEIVIEDIHSLNYITGAKVTTREQKSAENEVPQGPELSFANFTQTANQAALTTLRTATNGINILEVEIDDKITPVHPAIVEANKQRLEMIRKREAEIEREVTPGIEANELQANTNKIAELTQQLQRRNLHNSTSHLPNNSFLSNATRCSATQQVAQQYAYAASSNRN